MQAQVQTQKKDVSGATAAAPSQTTAAASSASAKNAQMTQGNVTINISRAISVNRSYGYSKATWKEIQSGVGLSGGDVDGICGKQTCQAIANWQAAQGFTGKDVDGICGNKTLSAIRAKGGSVETSRDEKPEETTKPESGSSEGGDTQSVSQDKSFRYFSLAELTRSDTARARGIDNSIPNKDIENKLSALIINCLDPLREAYGSALNVNSGYRCPALNKAVGGSTTSQHATGEAADLSAGSWQANKRIYDTALQLSRTTGFKFDQLINEYNYSWVHISYSTSRARMMSFSIG